MIILKKRVDAQGCIDKITFIDLSKLVKDNN